MSQVVDHSAPRGWAAATLGDIVEPRGGKVDPQTAPALPFIGMEHVEAHTARLLGTVPAASMKSSANSFKAGDVIYGRLRAYLNKVYQPDFDGLCSGEFIVLPESPGLSGRFLKYRLNAGDFVRFASCLNTGDRPRVDFEQLKPFSILLPPKSEQDRIADAIDELFSDLDAGVAALKRAQQKLALYRAVVLKVAVEGDLTADWRREHPNVEPASVLIERLLAERRRLWEEEQVRKFDAAGRQPPKNWKGKYKQPVAPETANLPSLPDGWCWVSIDQLISEPIMNGISVRGNEGPPGIPSLRLHAMTSNGFNYAARRYLPLAEEEVDDLWIRTGDFFVSRGNGSKRLVGRGVLAQPAPVPTIFPDLMMRLRFLDPLAMTRWVPTIWCSILVRRQIEAAAKTTAGIWKIAQPDLARLVLPMPPLSEQEVLRDAIEDQWSVIDHLEANIDSRLKGTQPLREAVLNRAFAGQLVPQDPNDEPASELLQRIMTVRDDRARQLSAKQRRPRSTGRHRKCVRMAAGRVLTR